MRMFGQITAYISWDHKLVGEHYIYLSAHVGYAGIAVAMRGQVTFLAREEHHLAYTWVLHRNTALIRFG